MSENDNIATNDAEIIYPKPREPGILEKCWEWITHGASLIFRFYCLIILILYAWAVKIIQKSLQPFEPVLAQIKKVPKQDIKAEGIFYQFLRLQFLILLYLSLLLVSVFSYLTQPFVLLRDWMKTFVEDADNSKKRTNPSELKED